MEPKYLANFIKGAAIMAMITPLFKSFDFYFPFVSPKGFYFMAIAEAVFFAWLVLAWRWKTYRPNFKNPVIAAMLLFLGISFLAAVFGADFSASFWSKFERMGGILMLCHLTAFSVAAVSVFEKKDWVNLFLLSVAVAAFVAANAILTVEEKSRGGGLIGNDSFWGSYLLFNIFIALYLFLTHKYREHKRIKIYSAAVLAIMAVSLLLEGSQLLKWIFQYAGAEFPKINLAMDIFNSGARAAKISLAAGILLLGLLRLVGHKNLKVRRFTWIFLGLAATIFAAIGVDFWQNKDALYQSLTGKFGESSIKSRMVVWEIGGRGFLERPVLGWGPENFNLVFAKYYNPCLGSLECGAEIWYDRAHNIVIDTLVETGAVGFMSYLLVFAAAVFVLAKRFFAGKTGFWEFGIFTALLAAYFLQNLTVFDMVASYLMFFVCLAFAAWVWDAERQKNKVWPQALGAKATVFSAAAAGICFIFFVLGPMTAAQSTVRAAAALGTPNQVGAYRQALEASPLGKYQVRLFFANQWLQILENQELASKIDKKNSEEVFSFLAGELEKSGRESPLDLQSRLILGRIYLKWSKLDPSKATLAENSLAEAIKISPKNQQAYFDLAQSRLNQSRLDDAAALIKQAHDLYLGNERAIEAMDRIEKFKNQTAAATSASPK